MEVTSQHLRISSPSSTAVRYTISSRANGPSKVVIFLRHVFRIVVAFYTALATTAKLQLTFASDIDPAVEELLQLTMLHGFLRPIIDNAQWWLLCITSLVTLYRFVNSPTQGTSLIHNRGEPIGASGSRCTDFDKLFVFFLESNCYFHTYHTNPRYCDT